MPIPLRLALLAAVLPAAACGGVASVTDPPDTPAEGTPTAPADGGTPSGAEGTSSPPLVTSTPGVGTEPIEAGTATPDPGGSTPDPFAGHTVGVIQRTSEAEGGYTLFAPMGVTTTYLVDMDGQRVQSWVGTKRPGLSVYLLEDGRLLRTGVQSPGAGLFASGGAGGYIELVDWDGTVTWSYTYSTTLHRQHHDVEYLPSGHILLIAWELKTEDETLAVGRRPDLVDVDGLWPDHVIEVDPDTSQIVWEWHVWDHLVQDYDSQKPNYGAPVDHPGRVDINYVDTITVPDWNHVNSVEYDADHDQILLSVHNFSEVWVIDHSTTTAEARTSAGGAQGKGGDLLYRWGNPEAWGAGTDADRVLYTQHHAEWIPHGYPGDGDVLLFNNGQSRDGARAWSSVDQLTPPIGPDGSWPDPEGAAFGPSALTWRWTADPPESVFASNISGAQRLPGGNTLICDGPDGTFYEVAPDLTPVWTYINPVLVGGAVTQGDEIPLDDRGNSTNNVFRATRLPVDYPGLAGRDLSPKGTLER